MPPWHGGGWGSIPHGSTTYKMGYIANTLGTLSIPYVYLSFLVCVPDFVRGAPTQLDEQQIKRDIKHQYEQF